MFVYCICACYCLQSINISHIFCWSLCSIVRAICVRLELFLHCMYVVCLCIVPEYCFVWVAHVLQSLRTTQEYYVLAVCHANELYFNRWFLLCPNVAYVLRTDEATLRCRTATVRRLLISFKIKMTRRESMEKSTALQWKKNTLNIFALFLFSFSFCFILVEFFFDWQAQNWKTYMEAHKNSAIFFLCWPPLLGCLRRFALNDGDVMFQSKSDGHTHTRFTYCAIYIYVVGGETFGRSFISHSTCTRSTVDI